MPHAMTNAEVAATFRLLADLLAIRGESAYKVNAYRRAAASIADYPEPVDALRERNRLTDIPGVGKEIARKIADLLATGTFRLLQDVETEFPPGLASLLTVPEIGPKRARALYQHLGIESLDALHGAIAQGRLAHVPGFGAREIERVEAGLRSLQIDERRMSVGVARPIGLDLIRQLRERAPDIVQIKLAGSARRFLETVGDLDIVSAAADPAAVVSAFVALPAVSRVEARGENRCRVMLASDIGADLWVLPPEHWGSLLLHVTGSKYHDIHLRDLTLARGIRTSEYGFLEGEKLVTCATEDAVYNYLGMQYIPPPMREDTGEIELALQHQLPAVVQRTDLRGDLHIQTQWGDGAESIRDVAVAARERGYDYIGIADRAPGLIPERLRAQRAEIDQLNADLAPFTVLHGIEVEVRADGSLTVPDDVLGTMDFVIAAIHSGPDGDRETLTRRAVAALRHPLVDALAHPTGRIFGERAGGDFDLDALFAAAVEAKTALEINGDPKRLDLRDSQARAAAAAGCTLMVTSGASSGEQLANDEYGIGIAQRAWLPAERILNTLRLPDLRARVQGKRHAPGTS